MSVGNRTQTPLHENRSFIVVGVALLAAVVIAGAVLEHGLFSKKTGTTGTSEVASNTGVTTSSSGEETGSDNSANTGTDSSSKTGKDNTDGVIDTTPTDEMKKRQEEAEKRKAEKEAAKERQAEEAKKKAEEEAQAQGQYQDQTQALPIGLDIKEIPEGEMAYYVYDFDEDGAVELLTLVLSQDRTILATMYEFDGDKAHCHSEENGDYDVAVAEIVETDYGYFLRMDSGTWQFGYRWNTETPNQFDRVDTWDTEDLSTYSGTDSYVRVE